MSAGYSLDALRTLILESNVLLLKQKKETWKKSCSLLEDIIKRLDRIMIVSGTPQTVETSMMRFIHLLKED